MEGATISCGSAAAEGDVFAVFGNEYQADKAVSAAKAMRLLAAKGAKIVVERPFLRFLVSLGERLPASSEPFDELTEPPFFAISLGGDGTLLKAAAAVGGMGVPIVGINTGRLGFLADVMPGEVEDAVDSLFTGRYAVQEHSAVRVDAGDSAPRYALNDVAVLKRDNASMITVRASVDGEPLATYRADGVVLSTPTGSTAYNLSAGGPIIDPGADVIGIAPVAPHSLGLRPIVIGGGHRVEMDVRSRSHNFLLAVDGRSEKLADGTRIAVERAPYKVKIARCSGRGYFSTLRQKLKWGVDGRE